MPLSGQCEVYGLEDAERLSVSLRQNGVGTVFFSGPTPFCRRDTLVLTYGQMALVSRPSNKLTRQFFGQVASPQTSLFLASRGHRMCDFRRSTSLLLSPYRKYLFQTLRPGISAVPTEKSVSRSFQSLTNTQS
jgi:hypothetical protein